MIFKLVYIAISAALVHNVLLNRFLGICPYLGISKSIKTSSGMGLAVMFVMTIAVAISYVLEYYLLVPYNLTFLRTLIYVLVIATLVQFVEIALKKLSYSLYEALGIFLPLITTNCAILGVALLSVQKEYNFAEAIIFALSSAIGFYIAIVIFAGIREELEKRKIPSVLKGMPIALVCAGILSLAFMGFNNLVK